MARTGSSSKFVPVNLNNSYGQALPLSNGGGASASPGLGRSRSFGGMVSLSRSSRVSSSPSSSSSSAASRASKLSVPRPVNLPSLRREHSGNDPTIALVGSHGSSGWSKQSGGDDSAEGSASRSEALKGDSRLWGSRAPAPDGAGGGGAAAEKSSGSGGRQPAYSPPGRGGEALIHGVSSPALPVVKAVVFRGEDFPTLQAAAAPPSPSLPPASRARDSQQKHRDNHKGFTQEESVSRQKEPHRADYSQESSRFVDRHLQPAQPLQMPARSAFLDQADDTERARAYHRGPSPLIKLAHTSNWADDERETLSSVKTHDSAQQREWGERKDGFQLVSNWSMDRTADIDNRRPLRLAHKDRNEPDFSMHVVPSFKTAHVKDMDFRRDHLDGSRFENNMRGDIERSSNNSNFGRNDTLKRGWSFPATDSHLNRDVRLTSPSKRLDQDGYMQGRNSVQEGNNVRRDVSNNDQDGVQWHGSNFGKDFFTGRQGKDAFQGRQGFSGGAAVSGSRSVRGSGLLFSGSDMRTQSGSDYKREKRVPELYDQLHNEDPFLGGGIRSRPAALYSPQPKVKKGSLNANDYRDPARESFEAELERVEKMLEQERQQAIEERDRAMELARKEQEEQERILREQEEMRRKVEEEAREAAYRAQMEAEEAARKVEEARRAREEEKRVTELEEERRKEAARRKLVELEERIAKRELEKRQEGALQNERGSNIRIATKEVSTDGREKWPRKNEAGEDLHWNSVSSPGKPDQDTEQVTYKMPVSATAPFPSIRRSSRGSNHINEENEFATEGVKLSQTWRKEFPNNGQEPYTVQKGPPKFLQLRSDRSQPEKGEQQQAPLLRNISALKSPARFSGNRASDDGDERDWWVRDISTSATSYLQNQDISEFPPYGRSRQSLPRQPRVLPPPPGNAILRKQPLQLDENQYGGMTEAVKSDEGSLELNQGNGLLTGDGNTRASNQDASIDVPEQFDAVPSDEMVLSDAGSQFSDDTIEDVVAHTEQEPELHSDIVSESFSDREVDEISDLTEVQESSEDGESLKPAVEQNEDRVVSCNKEGKNEVDESLDVLPHMARSGVLTCPEIEEQVEDGHFAQNAGSSCVMEDTATTQVDSAIEDVPVSENESRQGQVCIEVQDGQEVISKEEESTLEKTLHDNEVHPFLNQAAFQPVISSDVAQIRHLEGLSARQSLVQQFQQPFSFMAVPLPQSGTLSHVGGSLPTLSTVHTHPNQQELPFHVQLGLMPSLPLLPNAIKIGSIQMPLHIHPQIPQLSHLHTHQQAPVFQFGQIGPSLALSQSISMTQVPSASVQVLNASGQNNPMLHNHSQLDVGSAEANLKSADFCGRQDFKNGSAVKTAHLLLSSHESTTKNHAEVAQGPSSNGTVAAINTEEEAKAYFVKPDLEMVTAVADTELQLHAQSREKILSNSKLEAIGVECSSQTDHSARPTGRPSQGGRRRSNPPRYRGILGRGRGRFHGRGGHHFAYMVPQLAPEGRPDGAAKRVSRGKVFRRSYRRAEYRVREQSQLFDPEMAPPDSFSGLSSHIDDVKEGGGYRYVKRALVGHPFNSSNENGQLAGTETHSSEKVTAKQSINPSIDATSIKSKSLLRKYEVGNAEDAPFQTGVVRVFEQPGIETPNDKDDFIKVRSKRQLLRELRQQREKDNTSKSQDGGPKDLGSNKQPKVSAKIGGSTSGMLAANASKNNLKRKNSRSDSKSGLGSYSNGTATISLAASAKKSSASSKVPSASKAMPLDYEGSTIHGNDIHASEHSTIAAWGGQQSNQEVVSFTQIQLEEAMKPFRLNGPFSELVDSPDRANSPVEIPPCSSSLSVDKTFTSVKPSDPLSSLLAGEKIQFGAVTSPTLIPPENCPSTQATPVRTGSGTDFGSDLPRLSSHASSFVTNFLGSHLDATYTLKEDSGRKDDNYEGKAVDLEAEAEAAASAVVAAAISSEDLIDSHSNIRASEMTAGCSSISSGLLAANATSGQVQNSCTSDNPIAVALPADLSVESPRSLFQGSSMALSNSPSVVLQSLQGGAPTFPCLEMGPLIGGPAFNFGPLDESSLSRMEPGLSGWQQRHVGAPDSYYGSTPFLNPAGLSSIQGHPHMLVYTNPYTPVGQFGQLGLSFMGTTYHPSGKQPDWTYVPVPAAASGAVPMRDGDLNAVSNGTMAPQHHTGASNLIQTQRVPVTGSPVMSSATPPSLFDTGFAAPFQVSHMDGLVQSHWSKAPAPPLHGIPVAGLPVPSSLSRPGVDLNVHSNVLTNQGGHLSNLIEVGDTFSQRSMKNLGTGSSFSSAVDASAQFPDELGLGDSLPRVSSMQTEACGPMSTANQLSGTNFGEASNSMAQRDQDPSQSSQGHLRRELISSSGFQEQNRGRVAAVDPQNKAVGRILSPGMPSSSTAAQSEHRTFKQAGGEWTRGSQRKGASGRASTLEKGASVLPSKVKQIYVAKPPGDSRKLGAACI